VPGDLPEGHAAPHAVLRGENRVNWQLMGQTGFSPLRKPVPSCDRANWFSPYGKPVLPCDIANWFYLQIRPVLGYVETAFH